MRRQHGLALANTLDAQFFCSYTNPKRNQQAILANFSVLYGKVLTIFSSASAVYLTSAQMVMIAIGAVGIGPDEMGSAFAIGFAAAGGAGGSRQSPGLLDRLRRARTSGPPPACFMRMPSTNWALWSVLCCAPWAAAMWAWR